jgi:hypothetical protein
MVSHTQVPRSPGSSGRSGDSLSIRLQGSSDLCFWIQIRVTGTGILYLLLGSYPAIDTGCLPVANLLGVLTLSPTCWETQSALPSKAVGDPSQFPKTNRPPAHQAGNFLGLLLGIPPNFGNSQGVSKDPSHLDPWLSACFVCLFV